MAQPPILSAVVIGGEGFLGHNLVQALRSRFPQASVSSFDLTQRFQSSHFNFVSVDLTSQESLTGALKRAGADTVFHTASPWLGADEKVCHDVNVTGTETVIAACKEAGVKRLVYTSSGSVCFDETPLINIDERLTRPPRGSDPYNETKGKADAAVLAANDPAGLLTCCIRPSGIFGPGDRQGVVGFIDVLKQGKAKYQLGNNQNFFDWTYVDNVVHAHLLAAERLHLVVPVQTFNDALPPLSTAPHRRELPTSLKRPDGNWIQGEERTLVTSAEAPLEDYDVPLPVRRNRFDQFVCIEGEDEYEPGTETNQIRAIPEGIPVAGQAFYITNGQPIPFWDFAKALWHEYNGYADQPTAVPVFLGQWLAGLGESICWMLGKPEPTMSTKRIANAVTPRYFNIEKARRLLEYEPQVSLDEGIKRAVAWYKDAERHHPEQIQPKK